MWSAYTILIWAIVVYIACLLLVNAIPRVKVRAFRWMAICGVSFRLPNAKISIGRLGLKFNPSWSFDTPFRFLVVDIAKVVIVQTSSSDDKKSAQKPSKSCGSCSDLECVSFKIPKWLYSIFFRKGWINEIGLHVSQISYNHNAMGEQKSFFIDYLKLENTFHLSKSTISFTVSALDGYLRAGTDGPEVRLFHNLEIQARSALTLDNNNSRSLLMKVSNFEFLLAFGSLKVPELSSFIKTNKAHKDPVSVKPLPSKEELLMKFTKALSLVDLISSVLIKVEESTISYHDVKVLSSSYSLSLTKDKSYKQETKIRLYSNVTSAKIYHIGLKCLEIPSFSHILEVNLTDAYRARDTENSDKFFIDVSTTFTMMNPILNIFFDQFDLLWDASNAHQQCRNAKKKAPKVAPKDILAKYQKWLMMLRRVSFKLAVVDLKGTLHMPEVHTEKFERQSINNVVSNAELKAFTIKSSTKSLSNLLMQKKSGCTNNVFRSYLKIKNLSIDVEKNALHLSRCNALVSYCVEENLYLLNVRYKRLWIKSVNTMIFHVIRRIREARITHKNSACAQLSVSQQEGRTTEAKSIPHTESELLDLFSILPPNIGSIKLRGSYLLAYIICNDMLPSFEFYDKNLNEQVDLGKIKRGVSVSLDELNILYNKLDKDVQLSTKNIEASTLSDSSSEFIHGRGGYTNDAEADDISSIDSDLNTLNSFNCEKEVNIVQQVLTIPDCSVTNLSGENNRMLLLIPEIDAKVDIFLIWCVLYAQILLEMVAPKIERTFTEEQEKQLDNNSKYLLFDVHVSSLAVVAQIPHDVDVLFELDNVDLTNILRAPQCQINHCRLYCINPSTKLWSRLFTVSEFSVNLDAASQLSISLTSRTVRLNIPFQFLVYTVIDNLITMAKAARQIRLNFKNLSQSIHDFTSFPVHTMEAVKLPHIQWKTKTFGLTVENDAFETELAIIYELGMIEQIDRHRKMALFEAEAQKVRAKAADRLSKETPEPNRFVARRRTRTNTSKKLTEILTLGLQNHCHTEGTKEPPVPIQEDQELSSESFDSPIASREMEPENETDNEPENQPIFTEELAEKEIEMARDRLLADFSSAWIHKYQVFKRAKLRLWRARGDKTWGSDRVRESLAKKYSIQEYAPGPPQMYMIFKDFDISVQDPKLPDIHDFLHKYGKGTPKLDYSILVPALVQIKSAFVYAGAKDFLLPILSFPLNSDFGKPVFDFKGTFVVNEKLVAIPEELRHIYIPFSPAVAEIHLENNFYGSDVIRTLTPVKFMFQLDINLTTDRACVMSWNKSYQSTLLSAMLALDNFTKPEIDDSPLGWWDKLALNAHGKVRFNIKNELCLHIKSSLSPYALSAENSGFVFSWKDNVQLKINESEDPKEFLLLESDGFVLGIPNYSLPERGSWSLLYADLDEFTANDDMESRKFQKEVMKLTSDERVVWRLGVLFERNVNENLGDLSGNMKRTNKFKPHWDVCVTGPMYEYHPDSFIGYRSEYLHFAVSVTSNSKKGNSYNYAYLSPMTMKYFFVWWNTLTDSISLPIREGLLFTREAKKSSSIKFGPHLFTFKYQLILEPLVISYMVLSSGSQEQNHRVIGTGIKGKFSSCIIDLHQRKEVARYINDKLGIDKKVRKLKMNAGEIDVSDADIRLVQAQFSDVSLYGKLLSYFTGETNTLIGVDLFASERLALRAMPHGLHFFKGNTDSDVDYLWIDLNDFVELEYGEILSPDPLVKVVPFFQYPKLNYYREFTTESQTKYPFGSEPSHTCRIGSNSPRKVQADILLRKVTKTRSEITQNEAVLEHILSRNSSDNAETVSLKQAIDTGKAKMEKLQVKYDTLADTTSYRAGSIDEESLKDGTSICKSTTQSESIHESINLLEAASEMTKTEASNNEYHNRFLIHNLRMKWNNEVKEFFTTFLSLLGDKRSIHLSMSTKAVKLVENILKNLPKDDSKEAPKPMPKQALKCGDDVIQAFESYMNEVKSHEHELEHNYLVKFIRPQIQLQSDADRSSCTILTANDIELRIASLNIEGTSVIIHDDAKEMSLIETRHGVLLKDTFVYVFDSAENQGQETHPVDSYSGDTSSWPPWIDVEDCEEGTLQKNLVVEKTTMAISMTKPNMLSMEISLQKTRSSELVVHLAKMVINATSSQYSAIYFIMIDLIMGGKETKNFLRERVKQIIAVSEVSDFLDTSKKLKSLQENIKVCRRLLLKINEYTGAISDFHQRERDYLRLEIEKMKIELIILIRSIEFIGSKSSTKAAMMNWSLMADQIIIHLLNDDRAPLVDLALASSHFTRVEAHDGSNWNLVEVSMMQGFNLQPNTPYPVLLSPLSQNGETPKYMSSMIKMSWLMLSPVGGIRVMSDAKLQIQPLHVQLDYDTATKLVTYLFPKEDPTKESPVTPNSSNSDGSDPDDVSFDSANSSAISSSQFANKFRQILRKRDDSTDMSSEHSARSSRHRSSPSYDASGSRGMDSKPDSKTESRSESKTESKMSSQTSRSTATNSSKWKKVLLRKSREEHHSDEILLIMNRSSTYFVVGDFQVLKFKLCLSFRAPKHLNIIDVHNLTLSIPRIHYSDKTWSSQDFISQLQKDLIKIVLAHTGKIIGNKFRHRHREVGSTPLKQIANYSQFMTVSELQSEGRTEDERLNSQGNLSRSASKK
ncbi:hypothetical protein PUMCH_002453 [Australozyma saopauloensis]|uniref:FMP27 GFWDK domain-containing protein n=1 Tax=Australozyma saopauloensis TaxID=291208 RepID=A0AAX4H9E1_9ASCO|nr:hypothetical protein PUMCH_002453 [[Candida] saopauloensis]